MSSSVSKEGSNRTPNKTVRLVDRYDMYRTSIACRVILANTLKCFLNILIQK